MVLKTPLGRAGPPVGDERFPLKPGILFVGYVEAGLGLGESLRGLVTSTAEARLPFAIHPHNLNAESRFIGPFREADYDRHNAYEVTVIETTVDELAGAVAALGWRVNSGSRIVLRPYWELAVAPSHWAALIKFVDEIWAPTVFVAQAFRSIFDGPINIVQPCVALVVGQNLGRAHFGLDDSRFYYLFSFDYFSYPMRKNPMAVVRAFLAAFGRGNEPVGLVIKSTGPDGGFVDIRAQIAKAAQRDPRIVVMDQVLGRDDMVGLLDTCDAYVSLHRSEGFGFGMAEAMSFGKPVIGTDFSGSTDFLSEQTGYPIPFNLRRVREWEYPNADGQVWAEPNIKAAAKAMVAIFKDRGESGRRATTARAFIADRHGHAAIGRKVRQILMDQGYGWSAAI